MKEYIERDAAIYTALSITICNSAVRQYADAVLFNLNKLPAADVRPVVRGRWFHKQKERGSVCYVTGINANGELDTVQVDNRYEVDEVYCSECGRLSEASILNFCPNCGAEMETDNKGSVNNEA